MSILDQLGIQWQFLLVMLAGFLLLVWLLTKFAFGPLLNVLDERQNTIKGNLDEAEQRRDEMKALQAEYEERLAKIEEEARDKIQAAIKEAQSARDEILEKARQESVQVAERGRSEIERERQQSMVEMRDQIADMVTTAAGKVVKQELTSSIHTQLIAEAIDGIGAKNIGATATGAPAGGGQA